MVCSELVVGDQRYIARKVGQTASDFDLEDKFLIYKELWFVPSLESWEKTKTRVHMPYVDPLKVYELIGTYKSLPQKAKAYFRQSLLDKHFDIDENIFLLKELF